MWLFCGCVRAARRQWTEVGYDKRKRICATISVDVKWNYSRPVLLAVTAIAAVVLYLATWRAINIRRMRVVHQVRMGLQR